MGIPIILSLYLKPLRALMPYFMATNTVPNTDIFTVDCFFAYYCAKMVFTYIKKPLLDVSDTLSHA